MNIQNQHPTSAEREGWNTDALADEASNQLPDEIKRQTLRGNEHSGDPDERDNAGGSDFRETPQGSEENKINPRGRENH